MVCGISEWLLGIFQYLKPTPMDWVNLIIGMVALIMAVPSILQTFYGSPKVRVFINSNEDASHKVLICELVNIPVTGFLSRIGVTRTTVEYLAVRFGIDGERLEYTGYPATLRMPNARPSW